MDGAVSYGIERQTILLLLLNLLDGIFTTVFLQLGLAEELNPLMRLCWERSPLTFMAAKLCMVNVGIWLLWLNRRTRAARLALMAGVCVYAIVLVWHLAFLARLAVQASCHRLHFDLGRGDPVRAAQVFLASGGHPCRSPTFGSSLSTRTS